MVAIKVKSVKVFLCRIESADDILDTFLSCVGGWEGRKKEIYLFTKGLCVWMTRD